jgi:hypothetical protein
MRIKMTEAMRIKMTEAMRIKIIAAALVALMGLGTAGCKTASKMAWWKTAENADADSTVLAHSAPALPSAVARQADAVASTEVNITTGGTPSGLASSNVAAPFVPGVPATQQVTPAASHSAVADAVPVYPSTGASSFVPAPAQIATVATPDQSINLGSVAMPYNPEAVPAATVASTTPSVPLNPNFDRYTATATPSNASSYNSTPPANVASAATAYPVTSSGSGSSTSATPPQTVAATAVPHETLPGEQAAPWTPAGTAPDRYGNFAAATASPSQAYAAPQVFAQNSPVTPTTVTPYRPGGTGDYPGQAALEVAARPAAPASGSYEPTASPGVYTPADQQTPRYR